ncbi:MAG: hypothetical protein WAW96_06520 [Alphaproteobacteria bacterium]
MYFEIVKRILDKNVSAVATSRNKTVAEITGNVAAHLKAMSAQWYSGKAPTIAYGDPICRLAYLFAHVATNANLFEYVFSEIRPLILDEDDDQLEILVFGGGPGTELLGLAKHLYEKPLAGQLDVSIDIVDRVTEWNENISWLKKEISATYAKKFGKPSKWPARFSGSNYTLDFSNLKSFGNLPTLFEKNLFVFNFVLSEIFDPSKLLPVMRAMIKGSPDDAKFLFVDRSDDATIDKIDAILTALGLQFSDGAATQSNMDGDEQKSVLASYSRQLGRNPRVRWDAVWILAEKP